MADFGDIALVPFPFSDLSHAKLRPALVISQHSDSHGDIIFAAITSKPHTSQWSFRIDPTETNGLNVTSWVRLDKIVTLSPAIGIGKIGALGPDFLRSQKETFYSIFGFDSL